MEPEELEEFDAWSASAVEKREEGSVADFSARREFGFDECKPANEPDERKEIEIRAPAVVEDGEEVDDSSAFGLVVDRPRQRDLRMNEEITSFLNKTISD